MPTLCQPLNNFYRRLLSKHENQLFKRSTWSNSSSRERSSSEPNIHSNVIVPTEKEAEEKESNNDSQSRSSDSREPRARSADESYKKLRNLAHEHESIKDWEIQQNEIIIRECIGSGSYGTVFRGHWHGSVALKKLKVANPTQDQLQVCQYFQYFCKFVQPNCTLS